MCKYYIKDIVTDRDTVTFHMKSSNPINSDFEIRGNIMTHCDTWYISLEGYRNDYIFTLLGIEKPSRYIYSKGINVVNPLGDFPELASKEVIHILLNILKEEFKYKMKDVIISVPEGKKIDMDSIKFIDDIPTLKDLSNKANCYSEELRLNSCKQKEKIEILCDLILVADYLNGDWKCDFSQPIVDFKYFLYMNSEETIVVGLTSKTSYGIVYFKTQELAEKAIHMVGKERLKILFS